MLNRSYRVEQYNNGMKYTRGVQQQTRWSEERISELKDMAVEFTQSGAKVTKNEVTWRLLKRLMEQYQTDQYLHYRGLKRRRERERGRNRKLNWNNGWKHS